MSDIGSDKSTSEKPEKRKVIPLQKAYIWGTVFCLAALVAIILYNILKTTPVDNQRIDYLKLLRDSHSQAVKLSDLTKKGDKTIGDLQDLMSKDIGNPVVFPDWLGTDPEVEIIGVRDVKLRDDNAVILIYRYHGKLVDFITIYSKPNEIYELSTTNLENHPFMQYSWENNRGFFWELEEDNQQVTYGLISNMDETPLKQMALETMLSLKTYFEGKSGQQS